MNTNKMSKLVKQGPIYNRCHLCAQHITDKYYISNHNSTLIIGDCCIQQFAANYHKLCEKCRKQYTNNSICQYCTVQESTSSSSKYINKLELELRSDIVSEENLHREYIHTLFDECMFLPETKYLVKKLIDQYKNYYHSIKHKEHVARSELNLQLFYINKPLHNKIMKYVLNRITTYKHVKNSKYDIIIYGNNEYVINVTTLRPTIKSPIKDIVLHYGIDGDIVCTI